MDTHTVDLCCVALVQWGILLIIIIFYTVLCSFYILEGCVAASREKNPNNLFLSVKLIQLCSYIYYINVQFSRCPQQLHLGFIIWYNWSQSGCVGTTTSFFSFCLSLSYFMLYFLLHCSLWLCLKLLIITSGTQQLVIRNCVFTKEEGRKNSRIYLS